jgi:hypothetical protein
MARRRKNDITKQLNEVVQGHVEALVEAITAMVRQNTAREIADLIGGNGKIAGLRPRKKRILPCIAPGCKNPSKGPRFHYLCDKHRDAPKKDWELWQSSQREKRSA